MGSVEVQPIQQVAGGTAVRCSAAIMYAELRNFTRTSEMLPPERALELVDDFFALARRVVETHCGELHDTHNDTLMAAFCDGRPGRDAQHALAAAQDLLREFGALDDSWKREYGLRASLAIGMHLGEIVHGLGGQGALARPHVLGDCVSIANRLLHRARAGEYILSDSMMGALAAENLHVEAAPLPALEIARREPVKLYGVLPDTGLDFT